MRSASGPLSRGSAARAEGAANAASSASDARRTSRANLTVCMAWDESEVEHQALALGARYAQQHLVTRLALAFGEERVGGVRDTAQPAGDARPADALGTRAHDAHSLLGERLEDGLVRRYRDGLARARQLHLEGQARAARRRRVGAEELHVHGLRGPGGRGDVLDETHERTRPAHVEERSRRALVEQLVQVNAQAVRIERVVEGDLAGEDWRGQLLVESGVLH